ncbi:MAG: threonylcarbamoyl-AMP synthase [Corynebacteriales bacterium]|nr:threonylcarbamoyl-AMP synthase [Mycobacteriales bacterium]
MSELFDCGDREQRASGIAAAIQAVRQGELIVMPTDTVYGIGADAFNAQAVAGLLKAKGRGRDMPVPVLVGARQTVQGLVNHVSPAAQDLMSAFWPGGLTLVVAQAPSLRWDLGDTDGTVAVRMPLHAVALEVLAATGPMAVSSANISGQPAASSAEQARSQLGDSVDIYLESGPIGDPVASTIVDVTSTPRVLRQGAITLEKLRDVVPDIIGPNSPGAEQKEAA